MKDQDLRATEPFQGDDAALAAAIRHVLHMDETGGLLGGGIPGWVRVLLEESARRIEWVDGVATSGWIEPVRVSKPVEPAERYEPRTDAGQELKNTLAGWFEQQTAEAYDRRAEAQHDRG